MRVYVRAPSHLSRAMHRVARALSISAPPKVEIVRHQSDADLIILHVIGYPDTQKAIRDITEQGKKFAIIQYCLKSTSHDAGDWMELWKAASLVWSYYDLTDYTESFAFYHAPLGLDPILLESRPFLRDIDIMTSGYVSSGQEAIYEVAVAAERLDLSVFHLGPHTIQGMPTCRSTKWSAKLGISDYELAEYYRRSQWVSGLRWVEGFELPALEGLANGARPIVFDRSEMRHWYDGHAVFVPEVPSDQLIEVLVKELGKDPRAVTDQEQKEVRQRFQWGPIVHGFWERLCE